MGIAQSVSSGLRVNLQKAAMLPMHPLLKGEIPLFLACK
jgi:hypothetical protein